MVGLWRKRGNACLIRCCIFTFQYGWIMKTLLAYRLLLYPLIYIPVWLDYEARGIARRMPIVIYLHSSMVGLWRNNPVQYICIVQVIYIPVWLDYEACFRSPCLYVQIYLHSSMVGLWSRKSDIFWLFFLLFKKKM